MSKTVAITGHDSGLGRSVFELLDEVGFTCNGVDKSTSFSLTRDLDKIVDFITSSNDIFINNANKKFIQPELFQAVYSKWYNDPTKTIVNISCWSKYFPNSTDLADTVSIKAKRQLDKLSKTAVLDRQKTKCRIINITPGVMNRNALTKITPTEISEFLLWCLTQPTHLEITDLTILPRNR